jgi:hypothetical protein
VRRTKDDNSRGHAIRAQLYSFHLDLDIPESQSESEDDDGNRLLRRPDAECRRNEEQYAFEIRDETVFCLDRNPGLMCDSAGCLTWYTFRAWPSRG